MDAGKFPLSVDQNVPDESPNRSVMNPAARPQLQNLSAKDLRFGIVASRFNEKVVNGLREGALSTLSKRGADPDSIKTIWVPGALEIPLIAKKMAADPGIEVVGTARDGVDALEQVKRLKPDVITMDVTMPQLDGLGALERIMDEIPTAVVMLSALTGPQSKATIRAL
ncbi:MAG: 6,7-dimethyl-8-ribityllumazine synthase, partial [Planctomycetes bacterium]|nr:6,7-dimethyl-8-ribityllumazine synthase [Planctomycetota bacterium]